MALTQYQIASHSSSRACFRFARWWQIWQILYCQKIQVEILFVLEFGHFLKYQLSVLTRVANFFKLQ